MIADFVSNTTDKPLFMGHSQINLFNDLNMSTSDDAKTKALKRSMLVASLNTGRCTTPKELEDRFQKLFELCFNNNFIPTVEMLALATRLEY